MTMLRPLSARIYNSLGHTKPSRLFTLESSLHPTNPLASNIRFTNTSNPHQAFVFTVGACHRNGSIDASAISHVRFGPNDEKSWEVPVGQSFGEEEKEGEGEEGGENGKKPTNHRADLYAVLQALKGKEWKSEGFNSIVIGNHREYVVHGATLWISRWQENGWITVKDTSVKNQDLWKGILEAIKDLEEAGVEVNLWRIDGECQVRGYEEAKEELVELDEGTGRKMTRWDLVHIKDLLRGLFNW